MSSWARTVTMTDGRRVSISGAHGIGFASEHEACPHCRSHLKVVGRSIRFAAEVIEADAVCWSCSKKVGEMHVRR